MRLVFSLRAKRDLADIADWIARDDPDAAARFVALLEAKARDIRHMPLAFPYAPRLHGRGVRKRVVRKYLILYRVSRTAVRIVRIVDGRRNYMALLI